MPRGPAVIAVLIAICSTLYGLESMDVKHGSRVWKAAAEDAPPAAAWADARRFGAKGDGTTDDTAAIQAAINSFRTTLGVVFLPPGRYLISQLKVRPGISIWGVGMGETQSPASVLIQRSAVNESAIVNDPETLPPTAYWHWSEFRNFQLEKATPTTDTKGSGIDVNARTGEGFSITRVLVSNFPEAGIVLRRGGTTPFLQDLHLFGNGTYGLDMQRTSRDVWESVFVNAISGDDNRFALIRIKNAGSREETFHISTLKAEIDTRGRQPYIVELDTLNGATAYLDNISAAAHAQPGSAVVHIVNTSAAVYLDQIAVAGYPDLIVDGSLKRDVAYDARDMVVIYDSGALQRWQTTGFSLDGVGAQTMAPYGPSIVPLTIRGVSPQMADLQDWKDGAGHLVASVGPSMVSLGPGVHVASSGPAPGCVASVPGITACTISEGTDVKGTIATLGTPSGPGRIQITFKKAYDRPPAVMLTAANAAAASAGAYVSSSTTGAFVIATVTPRPGSAPRWTYLVVQ